MEWVGIILASVIIPWAGWASKKIMSHDVDAGVGKEVLKRIEHKVERVDQKLEDLSFYIARKNGDFKV